MVGVLVRQLLQFFTLLVTARPPSMKYRNLGSSDLRISEVCLGTMTWANQNTEEQAHAQIDRFIELGGNFIDTAELYPVPPGVHRYAAAQRPHFRRVFQLL